jgi:hypothetical protein
VIDRGAMARCSRGRSHDFSKPLQRVVEFKILIFVVGDYQVLPIIK